MKEITRGKIGEQGRFIEGRECVDQIFTVKLSEKYIEKRTVVRSFCGPRKRV